MLIQFVSEHPFSPYYSFVRGPRDQVPDFVSLKLMKFFFHRGHPVSILQGFFDILGSMEKIKVENAAKFLAFDLV